MSAGTPRVLIIDDETAMRDALKRLLGAKGFEVTTATSGKEALEAAQPGRFDLVLLDLWMPEMNGLQTLEKFRAIDPWVPVIAVSAMGTDATIATCRAAGATGFLPKPFSASDIEDLLREAKAGRRAQEDVASGAAKGWRGKLLVADDHVSYRAAIARRLRLDGFDVDEVGSGAEVAMLADGAVYDALLLDIHMPGGDGLFAAEEVRKSDPFLPIIFMSGEASESEMRKGLRTSAAGCLRKPVEMDRLAQILEFLISTGRKSRAHALARSAYEELSPLGKARVQVARGWRDLRRSRETSRVALGLIVAVVLAILAFRVLDSGQRAALHWERSWSDAPSPFEMYRTIVGYLERDEQRELEQQERAAQ